MTDQDLEEKREEEEKKEQQLDLEIVERHIAQLRERFDTVHIFASRKQPGDQGDGTIRVEMGAGNWYARYGQIKLWTVREEGRELPGPIE